jgi:predicted GNAT family acetyltransferase
MVLTPLELSAIENPQYIIKNSAIDEAEKGYEDIHSDTPYIDFDIEGDKALIHLVYMPPKLRGHGFGKAMFANWLNQLDTHVTHAILKSCSLATGHTKPFWTSLGFKSAYYGCTDTDEGDATDILVMGTNKHETPDPVELLKGQSAHYIFGVMD